MCCCCRRHASRANNSCWTIDAHWAYSSSNQAVKSWVLMIPHHAMYTSCDVHMWFTRHAIYTSCTEDVQLCSDHIMRCGDHIMRCSDQVMRCSDNVIHNTRHAPKHHVTRPMTSPTLDTLTLWWTVHSEAALYVRTHIATRGHGNVDTQIAIMSSLWHYVIYVSSNDEVVVLLSGL